MKHVAAMKKAGEIWRTLSEADKAPFVKQYEAGLQQYLLLLVND
jgi:hypothetical protein